MNCETGSQWAVTKGIHDEELVLQVQAQLEEMFSDACLAEDGFVLRLIQKNKGGFVSLKLLTYLKKIKVLTNNWYVTRAAAVLSPVLEVNPDSTKVCRLRAYPHWLVCSPISKLLLLWNLPPNWLNPPQDPHPSLSKHIISRFRSYGTVLRHWVLLPGQNLPQELQSHAKRKKELGRGLCVVVKFDTLAATRTAYGDLKAEEMSSSGRGVHVVSLGYRSPYLIRKEQPKEEMSQGDEAHDHLLKGLTHEQHADATNEKKKTQETPRTSLESSGGIKWPKAWCK